MAARLRGGVDGGDGLVTTTWRGLRRKWADDDGAEPAPKVG